MEMGTFSGTALFSPLVQLRGQSEVSFLTSQDRSDWPRCFPWHGWLPGLSLRQTGTPLAVAAGLESRLVS